MNLNGFKDYLKDLSLFLAVAAVSVVISIGIMACPPVPPPSPMPPDADAFAPPPPPPVYDGSTTSDCFLACQALQKAGCREGSGNCITRLQTINDLRTEQNLANGKRPLTCVDVEKVKTPADFKAMGQVCTLSSLDGG